MFVGHLTRCLVRVTCFVIDNNDKDDDRYGNDEEARSGVTEYERGDTA